MRALLASIVLIFVFQYCSIRTFALVVPDHAKKVEVSGSSSNRVELDSILTNANPKPVPEPLQMEMNALKVPIPRPSSSSSLSLALPLVSGEQLTDYPPRRLVLGTKYLIRSGYGKQDCYITVHEDGTVDSQYLIAGAKDGEGRISVSPMQIWSIAQHPYVADRFTLVQDVLPFNDLSGYQNREDDPNDPPTFPRQFTFTETYDEKYQIEIRVRWCLRFLGHGYTLDIDDCEAEYEPEKLWDFIEVANFHPSLGGNNIRAHQ